MPNTTHTPTLETRLPKHAAPMLHVGVVVLNWQQFQATKRCVESLLRLTGLDEQFKIDIVVCDNASRDGSANLLELWVAKQGNDSLHFLSTGYNGGYAFGNNRGIEYLLANAAPDYFWILNNDTEVDAQCLHHLLAAASVCPEVLVWGSTLVNHKKRDLIECAGGYRYCPMAGRVQGHLAGAHVGSLKLDQALDDYGYYAHSDQEKESRFDYVSGAAWFCKASVFEQHGLMSEDYFLYYEEYDFVKRMGPKAVLGWCPLSVVYHVGGLSTGGESGIQRSATQQYYDVLNTLKFTCRYHKPWLPSVLLTRILTQFMQLLVRGEWRLVAVFFGAVRDFMVWLFGGRSTARAPRKPY